MRIDFDDSLESYIDSIDQLIGADDRCQVSEDFERIRAGWAAVNAYQRREITPDDIAAAASAGDPSAVARAIDRFTLANQGRPDQYRLHVARELLTAIRIAYASTALDNYSLFAERFDGAASRLAAASAVCDLATPAEVMVSGGTKERTAWTEATLAAKDLDALLPLLAHAATLAGADTSVARQQNSADWMLALACAPTIADHRRRVWEAWENDDHRCGRWGALAGLGITIRAADLRAFEPYPRPLPMTVKQVPGRYKGYLGTQQVPVDPEDALVGRSEPAAASS